MFVTLETSQEPMSRLKLSASSNMNDMSVTLEMSQELMSWLKLSAPSNTPLIFVTPETSHWPMLLPDAVREVAPSNILRMLVTPDRSGVSEAEISRLEAPEAPRIFWPKASSIVDHWMSPH